MQRTINDVMDEYQDTFLEEETYRNIVLFIRRESLLRIMRGESALDVIPEPNQRSKLHRDEVLENIYDNGKRTIVHPRARRLLEEYLRERGH